MSEAYNHWVTAHKRSKKYASTEPDWTWTPDESVAGEVSRVKGAKAISKGPAGSIHPHKLATHFLQAALKTGNVELFSWAPVSSFSRAGVKAEGDASMSGSDGEWVVDCGERGQIRSKRVVVCTNAHTRHLFPGQAIDKQYVALSSIFFPIRTPNPSDPLWDRVMLASERRTH